MALLIPPGFGQVSVPLRHAGLTRAAAITFGVELEGGGSPPGIANGIQATIGSTILSRIDSQVTVGPVRVTIGQDGGDPLVGFADTSIVGARSGSTVPPALAALVEKRTSLGGRRNRGYLYMPWTIAEGAVDEAGIITGTEVSGLQSALSAWMDALDTNSTPMVVLHSTGVTAPPDPTPVDVLIASPIISNQVRRQTR